MFNQILFHGSRLGWTQKEIWAAVGKAQPIVNERLSVLENFLKLIKEIHYLCGICRLVTSVPNIAQRTRFQNRRQRNRIRSLTIAGVLVGDEILPLTKGTRELTALGQFQQSGIYSNQKYYRSWIFHSSINAILYVRPQQWR